jgi:hypothetical protein
MSPPFGAYRHFSFYLQKINRSVDFYYNNAYLCGRIGGKMLYDIVFPESEALISQEECVIAASYFDVDELKSFGVSESAFELDDAFVEENEFEKVFKLWESPLYLHRFFIEYESFFQQDYWDGITEGEFVNDVLKSVLAIKRRLLALMRNRELHSIVEPLDLIDKEKRDTQSIRVKIKEGSVIGRYVFRFYAIEIEERHCYLITGATIKVHKDMGKAPNTEIELLKIRFAYDELMNNGVDTKELFIDFILS